MTMRLAYFVNQYPKVSHSFIRREILALEALGLPVQRYALRGWDDASLADPADLAERERTRFVLQGGMAGLLWQAVGWALKHPGRMLSGLRAALAMARGGDRTPAHHLVALLEAVRLVDWLAADGATHLHAHFGTNSAEVAHLVRALGGPPYSFTVHGSEEWDMPQQLKLREKVRDAAFVVGISAFTCAQLMRWSRPEDWPKLHQVHCGLDAAFFEGPATPAPDNRRLLCIGRLCKEKAQLLLIDAVARLAGRGVALELVLAGDGEDRALIEARIAHHGLADRVRITGWVSGERIRAELLASRALVLASFAEALPVVLMEAMALRRPVVATIVGGVAELVRDNLDGWLVPAGSVGSLADAIEHCLASDIKGLRAMGDRGHERVLLRHRADDQAARLAALFRQAAG
jgi:colanic acid/amylovoran biosynthesis glycosyltransferase